MEVRKLAVLSYAGGFTEWHFRGGAETLADVAEPGFFNASAEMLAPGDMIMISAVDGGRIVFVTATVGGVVTEGLK